MKMFPSASVQPIGSTWKRPSKALLVMQTASLAAVFALSTLVAASDSGTLAVRITRLPPGFAGAVTVSGPNGFAKFATARRVFSAAPGDYTVSAENILSGTTTHAPQPPIQTVTVGIGGTTTKATVSYDSKPLALALQEVVAGLDSPLFLTAPAGDPRLFIVERPGRIRIVENGALLPTPFLDISARTTTDGERGLLSMAFHPDYAANGFFFLYFTDPNGDIAIERFSVSDNPNIANPAPTRVITIEHQAFSNHNGGLVAFGPDGYLYFGTGDGGGAGDTLGNGQNLDSLLGKLLRLDVSTVPYTIPPDNPFVGNPDARGEIWAYGLRNPWRFDFGAKRLYIADVGQNLREEVNVVRTQVAGVNYGWNITEGRRCFPGPPCDKTGLRLPAVQYRHTQGCSITGGFEYRGAAIPELRGRYFYSDLCSGFLRSFVYRNGTATEKITWNVPNVALILSFGEDSAGELYMLSENGSVYRIVRG
jgi:glucose/arabinose dehydrogenase